MAGISSKAVGKLENKKKFVSQELDDDFGVNWYQFKFRNHDPQIGRFIQIDPLATDYAHNSTYAYAENRPIDGIDMEGLEYMRAGEALIRLGVMYDAPNKRMTGMQIMYNTDNVSGATKEAIRRSPNGSGVVVGELIYEGNVRNMNGAEMGDITNPPNSLTQSEIHVERVAKDKRQEREIRKSGKYFLPMSDVGGAQRKFDRFSAVISVLTIAMEQNIQNAIDTDEAGAKSQAPKALNVFADISVAIENNFVPSKLLDQGSLTALANYLLSGEKPVLKFYTTKDGKVKAQTNKELLHEFESIHRKIVNLKK
ncbi:MAG: hypothetical protein HC867_06530 [Bacteroidia bacterium]|nr:hypothetical protein [Bacteroidia bacterium]